MADHSYYIDSQRAIVGVLRDILGQAPLIHMRVKGAQGSAITTLLDVNADKAALVIDAAQNDAVNRMLARTDTVFLDTQLAGIRIRFSTGPAQALSFEGRPAWALPFPTKVERLQRRAHFRIDIPANQPLLCRVRYAGQQYELRVKNISAGGVALLDPAAKLSLGPNERLLDITLDLGELGQITSWLQVLRIEEASKDGSRPQTITGRFLRLPPAELVLLQRYIGQLERLLNARKRGFD